MKRKIYEPVRNFERQTSYCPLYLAWRIVDEARDYFRTELIPSSGSGKHKKHRIRPADTFSPSDAEKENPMGEGQLARKLARRAEAVIAHQPWWRKEAMSARGYGHILSFMRHWLAGILHQENPVLYRQLPESFKIGLPLPETPNPVAVVYDRRPRSKFKPRRLPPTSCHDSRERRQMRRVRLPRN